MSEAQILETPEGRRLAYHKTDGAGPGILFCGGFGSDMEGTKAIHLETWARNSGRAFIRFDYSGHGQSSERFEDGTIGDWARDAETVLDHLTEGPQIVVGSSMGGWIALLLGKRRPERLAGFVGIAAAPDFTEDGYWAEFSEETRKKLLEKGSVLVPSDYGDPLVVTRRLIENGRENLVLRSPLKLPFPVRLLQGTADQDVSYDVAIRLLNHVEADSALTLVKDADHRFSTPECLRLIEETVEKLAKGA